MLIPQIFRDWSAEFPDLAKQCKAAAPKDIARLQKLAGPLPASYVEYLQAMGDKAHPNIDIFSTGTTAIDAIIQRYELGLRPPPALPNLYREYLVIGVGSLEHDRLYLSRRSGTLHHGDGYQVLPAHSGSLHGALQQELFETLIARSPDSRLYSKDSEDLDVIAYAKALRLSGLGPKPFSDDYRFCAESHTLRLVVKLWHTDVDETSTTVFVGTVGSQDQGVYEALAETLEGDLDFTLEGDDT